MKGQQSSPPTTNEDREFERCKRTAAQRTPGSCRLWCPGQFRDGTRGCNSAVWHTLRHCKGLYIAAQCGFGRRRVQPGPRQGPRQGREGLAAGHWPVGSGPPGRLPAQWVGGAPLLPHTTRRHMPPAVPVALYPSSETASVRRALPELRACAALGQCSGGGAGEGGEAGQAMLHTQHGVTPAGLAPGVNRAPLVKLALHSSYCTAPHPA